MQNKNQRQFNLAKARKLSFERLERREVLAGNISAVLRSGSLFLTGDGAANEISITPSGSAGITITGVGTTVNGSSSPVTLAGFRRDLSVNLFGGDDAVHFQGSAGNLLKILGNLNLSTDDGNDQVSFADVMVGGVLTLLTGTGRDQVSAAPGSSEIGLRVAKHASLITGAGADAVILDHVHFQQTSVIDMGADDDGLSLANSSFGKGSLESGGPGRDDLQVAGTTFGKTNVILSFETRGSSPAGIAAATSPTNASPPPGDDLLSQLTASNQPAAAGEGEATGTLNLIAPGASGEASAADPTESTYVITQDLTLCVSPSGDDTTGDGSSSFPWGSIQRAFDYLADKMIASYATVTISVADGTYTMTRAVELRHPCGGNIHIVGNTTSETSVILDFTQNTEGIFLSNGCSLGLLDGFTIRGTWSGGGSTGLGKSGIRASHNASISLGDHMAVQKFYYGVQADQGGFVEADYIKVTNAGDGALFAYDGGVIDATSAYIRSAVDTTRNLGGGVVAEVGGIIRCNQVNISGCQKAGIQCIGGSVRADFFVSRGNIGYGVMINRNGVVDSDGACFANGNGSDGFRLESGGCLRAYGAVTANNNAGSGINSYQGLAIVGDASHFNGNKVSGVFAQAGSNIKLGNGSTCNSNKSSGVDAFSRSYVELISCTVSGNTIKGLKASLGSFIYAKGTPVFSNGQNTSITINKLSTDGSMIKTI